MSYTDNESYQTWTPHRMMVFQSLGWPMPSLLDCETLTRALRAFYMTFLSLPGEVPPWETIQL
jgi:hypothetical protein